MNFQPQPYPLFVAFYGPNDKIQTGRVVGWSVPEDNDVANLKPLAVIEEASGITRPKCLELEKEQHFFADSISDALASLRMAS